MARGDRSRGDGERSSEERERDRQERERRRALRAGGAAAATHPEPEAQPSDQTPAAPEPTWEQPDAAPVQQPDRAPVPDPAGEPHQQGSVPVPPLDPVPPLEPEPAAAAGPDTRDLLPAGDPPGAEQPPSQPAVTGRAAAPVPPLPPAPPPPPAAPRLPVPGGDGRRRSGRALVTRIAAVLALVVVVGAVVLLAKSLGSSSSPKPVAGPVVVRVLVPEGKTRAQIAEIAKASGLTGSYRLVSRRSPLLNPEHYGAAPGTPDLEGFLFPATYELDAGAPASRLVEEQLVAFKEHFGAVEFARAHALGVTPYELLIVASMVEREAVVPGDRPKIAAVIYNRLKAGMPLGIDASIYYAVELRDGIATYTGELTEADLHTNSPYNTRTHTGLPPTPISNPGEASIHAAAYPAQVSYLYYVAGADGCGEQVFSNTDAEFEVNAAAYKAAVAKNGGRPPTCKHK